MLVAISRYFGVMGTLSCPFPPNFSKTFLKISIWNATSGYFLANLLLGGKFRVSWMINSFSECLEFVATIKVIHVVFCVLLLTCFLSTCLECSNGSQRPTFLKGSRGGAVVRALAYHQCVPGSIPGPGVICGLSLLLVLALAPRVLLRLLRFSSLLKNQHF